MERSTKEKDGELKKKETELKVRNEEDTKHCGVVDSSGKGQLPSKIGLILVGVETLDALRGF